MRVSHGKARPELPRSGELPTTAPPPVRTHGRDARGRFTTGHGLRHTRSWDRRIQELLGCDLEGEAAKLGLESHHLYRRLLAELPCLTVGVQSLVAQRARAATLAGFFARHAAAKGLGTPEADTALRQAALWDQRAERLAVTAWDLSTRAANAAAAKPIDAHAQVIAAFGAPQGGGR